MLILTLIPSPVLDLATFIQICEWISLSKRKCVSHRVLHKTHTPSCMHEPLEGAAVELKIHKNVQNSAELSHHLIPKYFILHWKWTLTLMRFQKLLFQFCCSFWVMFCWVVLNCPLLLFVLYYMHKEHNCARWSWQKDKDAINKHIKMHVVISKHSSW